MFSSSHSDRFPDFDDDWFKEDRQLDSAPPVMEIVLSLGAVIAVVVLTALCCKCCCGSRSKGRVLQPPPDPAVGGAVGPPVAYPQQQYNTVTVPTGMIVGNVSGYPPAPTSSYPVGAPYPTTTGAPYGGGAPYHAPAPAPYPSHVPYPAGGMPQPGSHAPSAPAAHAVLGTATGLLAGGPPPPVPAAAGWYPHPLPPTYEQVMSAEVKHSTPYNPYAPH